MPSIFWTIALIALFLDTGVSIVLNTCIVISAAKSMRDGMKLSPPDVIHLVMGLVNLSLQCCLTSQSLLFALYRSVLFIEEVYLPVTILILTLIYFSSWLNAWLSSCYCTSIANFTHPLFLWSRKMISTSLWLLLLLSAVASCILSVLSIWALNLDIETSSLDNCTGESSFIRGTFYFSLLYNQMATVLGSFLPFMLTLLSILLTFFSLLRHVKKIKLKYSGFTQRAHVNAIKRMCLLLILTAMFCIAQLMFFSSRPSSSLDALVTTGWSIILIFPVADAIIIILASSKIQKIFMKTFCAGT